jgi:hypothetical protein
MKHAICDASPLITLARAGLLNALPNQLRLVFCLQAVVDEILAGPPEDVMRKVSPELLRLFILRSNRHE